MEKRKVSPAQRKATEKYLEGFEDIRIRVPKGEKQVIKAHAESTGESVNAFAVRAISETMSRDKASSEAAAGHEDLKDIPQADQSGETAPPAADDLG